MGSTYEQSQNIIVGIVGGAASGKDLVAELFAEQGYGYICSGDLVREEIAARGQAVSREVQNLVANELRETQGTGYWIDQSLAKIGDRHKKIVISGLYAPGEGDYISNRYGGTLIGVTVGEDDDEELRFARLITRSDGTRDEISREEFIQSQRREMGGCEPHQANVGVLLSMAHFTIRNTAGIDYLQQQVTAIITEIEGVQ